MAEGHKNGAKDTAKGFEETSEDGKKHVPKTFSVDSKKNYGPQIYGDNHNIEISNNFYYLLTDLNESTSERSSETDRDSAIDKKQKKTHKKKPKKKKKYVIKSDACYKTEPKKATVSDGVCNKTVRFLKTECRFNEESSDSERDFSRKKKKITTKREKKKNGSVNDGNDSATGQNMAMFKDTEHTVFVQNSSSESQDLSCDHNMQLHSTDERSAPTINSSTLRKRSGKAKKHRNTTTKTERIDQDSRKKSTKSLDPVRIGLIQMFCYFLCVVVSYYMEWPLWILPYICYLVFVIIIMLACISCVRFKYIKSEPDQENDTEAFLWFGFGINDESTLLKLVCLFLTLSLAFLSGHVFGCVSCSLKQTIILFILSTTPYLYFEEKFHLKVLQEQSKVFKDIDNQRLLDSSANNML